MLVLITGGSGFVGTNLSGYLIRVGHEVITTDVKGGTIEGDITDSDFTLRKLGEQSFDAIIHLAAIANIKYSVENPYDTFRVNMLGTINTLELAARKNLQRYIYPSTANVYGIPKKVPVDEEVPWNPRSPYDHSKCAAELAVQSFMKARGVKATILRSWKLFGPHDVPNAAIPRFIRSALQHEPIPLYNAGKDRQDVNYIDNYCGAMQLVLRKDEAVGKIFNIGSGREISIREVAERIVEFTGSKSIFQLLPPRTPLEAEPMRSYPSIKKARDILGYEPLISLDDGLMKTISWFGIS